MKGTGKHATLLKVVILGDGGVGKSSLMNRFVNNEFDAQSFHTIGVEFLNKDIFVGDEHYTMQIWDTAGQERFKSLRTPFYRGTDCCLLVFDVSDQASFENISMWKEEFIHYADVQDRDTFPFVLIGNKVDTENRAVKREEAEQWVKLNGGSQYFETSAKSNIHVERAFIAAAELLKSAPPLQKADHVDMININKTPVIVISKESCC